MLPKLFSATSVVTHHCTLLGCPLIVCPPVVRGLHRGRRQVSRDDGGRVATGQSPPTAERRHDEQVEGVVGVREAHTRGIRVVRTRISADASRGTGWKGICGLQRGRLRRIFAQELQPSSNPCVTAGRVDSSPAPSPVELLTCRPHDADVRARALRKMEDNPQNTLMELFAEVQHFLDIRQDAALLEQSSLPHVKVVESNQSLV
ncbi:hypothetical protein RB195_010194 [Necator americanus]|uniref:Uncharacterized protein n=1 Tax=Necator americanus TaxID=51031 RepID=A0ABR1CWV2_NECAM